MKVHFAAIGGKWRAYLNLSVCGRVGKVTRKAQKVNCGICQKIILNAAEKIKPEKGNSTTTYLGNQT